MSRYKFPEEIFAAHQVFCPAVGSKSNKANNRKFDFSISVFHSRFINFFFFDI